MAGELPQYTDWIRRQGCALGPGCSNPGPSTPHHHPQKRGLGQRAHDRYAIPACTLCHTSFHKVEGRFRGYTQEKLRQAQNIAVFRMWARWVGEGNEMETLFLTQEAGDVF